MTSYWIDDDADFVSDSGSSAKKQITAVVQGADSRHSILELSSSMFNNDGDSVALFSLDGVLLDHYQYSNDPGEDISIGRSPDGAGGFALLTNATRGSANSQPKPPDTPTPEPTSKPTRVPTETKTPTSIPTERVKSTSLNPTISLNDDFDESTGSTRKSASIGARPTSILGVSTKSAEKKPTQKSNKEVLVKGVTSSVTPLVAMSFGGLFLLSCGILLYVKKKGLWAK